MVLTMVFSGPTANGPQVRNALAGAGLTVQNIDSSWGLPAMANSSTPSIPQTFVTVSGTDANLDSAAATASQYGFVLRAHWPFDGARKTPKLEVAGTDYESRIAELERKIAALGVA